MALNGRQRIHVDGKQEDVFVLKDGEENIIYIPFSGLQRIDFERLVDVEKKPGEMLHNMKNTTLDNGKNALVLYRTLIKYSSKSEKKTAKQEKSSNEQTHEVQETASNTRPTDQTTTTAGKKRGRPKGSGSNKKSTQ